MAIGGALPYVDLFDHKGPIIFLIDAFGYKIGALWILQVISLFITLLGIYDITKQFKISNIQRIMISLCSLAVLLIFYSNGNLTEEYCLPFLSWSLSKEIGYLKENKIEHAPQYALLYGVTFSVGVLTRVTNAVPICGMILIIAFQLTVHKKWINLFQNIFMFLAGVVITIIPFIVYFVAKNGLYEAVYGTLLYNFVYGLSEKSVFLSELSIKSAVIAVLNYSVLIGLLFSGILKSWNDKKLGTAYIFTTFLCLYVSLSGQSYLHYAMIIVPLNVIPLAEIFENLEGMKRNGLLTLYCVVVCIAIAWNGHIFYNNYFRQEMEGGIEEYKPLSESILEDIPTDDRDSVVGYNITVSTYLAWDIQPCYTYFHHQDWQGEKSSDLMEKIRDEYQSCKAKWIITADEENGISDILEEKYSVVAQYDIEGTVYDLYSRNSDVEVNKS